MVNDLVSLMDGLAAITTCIGFHEGWTHPKAEERINTRKFITTVAISTGTASLVGYAYGRAYFGCSGAGLRVGLIMGLGGYGYSSLTYVLGYLLSSGTKTMYDDYFAKKSQ